MALLAVDVVKFRRDGFQCYPGHTQRPAGRAGQAVLPDSRKREASKVYGDVHGAGCCVAIGAACGYLSCKFLRWIRKG